MAILEWFGNEVQAKVEKAVRQGLEDTMGPMVIEAVGDVPRVTTILQGSIRYDPPEMRGDEIVGEWGSFDVNYAEAVETGDRSKAEPESDYVKEQRERLRRRTGQPGFNTGNTGSLRKAFDNHSRDLADNIRKRYARL